MSARRPSFAEDDTVGSAVENLLQRARPASGLETAPRPAAPSLRVESEVAPAEGPVGAAPAVSSRHPGATVIAAPVPATEVVEAAPAVEAPYVARAVAARRPGRPARRPPSRLRSFHLSDATMDLVYNEQMRRRQAGRSSECSLSAVVEYAIETVFGRRR